MSAATWRGRRGSVLLGSTQDRVARYLEDRTRHGRVRIRTTSIVRELGIGRSEVYRITAALRVLGLFGIDDDQGGTQGGRYYWRTRVAHDGDVLDASNHREAWRRILGWGRHRRARAMAGLARLRATIEAVRPDPASVSPRDRRTAQPAGAATPSTAPAGDTFEERMRRAGLGQLIDEWKTLPKRGEPA